MSLTPCWRPARIIIRRSAVRSSPCAASRAEFATIPRPMAAAGAPGLAFQRSERSASKSSVRPRRVSGCCGSTGCEANHEIIVGKLVVTEG